MFWLFITYTSVLYQNNQEIYKQQQTNKSVDLEDGLITYRLDSMRLAVIYTLCFA